MGISDRGTKAKSITSCDNAFVTNIVLARDPGASNASEAAHRTPLGSSVRKRSVSDKALSRNGNQPLVLQKSHTFNMTP
ncbi:hypothetical protein [Lysinibacillus xylanilyticus]|uniref:hypothetical protein n=1 Tax=Lysinibacillus xylanilyticus TaxID=582475 RepID=UPI003D0505A8